MNHGPGTCDPDKIENFSSDQGVLKRMNTNWLLHYPVWELGFWGGGFLIALIATVHVYVAHFAVGGGLFLVLTELKGYRENSRNILGYTMKHSKFFMLLTMVFGSVTGVGIWFVISLLSPAATSVLVHDFVFGWATEWLFFIGEIVTLFVYVYTFGKMSERQHVRVGWLYFGFAWLSLFVINGIVAFMLTPGNWIETRDFWQGFFNPTFLPALFFRTCMAFMLAGLFGFITAVRIKDAAFRESMIQYCSWWLLVPFFFLLQTAYWYALSLPEPQKIMIFSQSPEILPFLKAFAWISPIIFIIGVIITLRVPVNAKKIMTYCLLFIGLMYMGAFEWIREAGRRPYLIHGYMYSNSVLAKDADAIGKAGLLKSARWAKNREISESNRADAGREIFNFLCLPCHSIRGPMNDILPLTEKFSLFGMNSFLDGMGKINEYMPQFMGNAQERNALAVYISEHLHQKPRTEADIRKPESLPVEIPPFDSETDEYVLLGWSSKGMHAVSDCERYFTLSPAGNDIHAMLIRRGETPEQITDAVVTYQVQDAKDRADIMNFDVTSGTYTANPVLSPYTVAGDFNPYPLARIEAKDSKGNLLASTRTVSSVSTEMGCKTCHGGKWRVNGTAGFSPETARDILSVHDRMSKTDLLKTAEKGEPKACYDCHSQTGGKLMNLSAAIHGFHANYLTDRDADACAACHPSEGFTQGFRGIHSEIGLNCTQCHGKMEDHALSLLTAEKHAGKPSADRLMKYLLPKAVKTSAEITPRKPWVNEPDCLNCHIDFNPPETDTAEFGQWTATEKNLYRSRADDTGIACAACHGSPHAEYPASNIFGNDRDNIAPIQYQKKPYPIGADKNCKLCHIKDMEEEIHHPNSLGMFRNSR